MQDEINARPAREWIMSQRKKEAIKDASTAAVKGSTSDSTAKGSKRDRDSSDKEKSGDVHRLSRKKRRRIEARNAEAAETQAAVAAGEDKPMSDGAVKTLVKNAKKEAQEKKRAYGEHRQ
jgi:hypothetical protein